MHLILMFLIVMGAALAFIAIYAVAFILIFVVLPAMVITAIYCWWTGQPLPDWMTGDGDDASG